MNSSARRVALAVVMVLAVVGTALPAFAQAVFVNEIHYDNDGTDSGEAIEIAGPAGTDLTGWSIVLYNGSTGATYDTDALAGTIPNTCGGYGVVVVNYPSNGIQNGAPDGLALVNASSVVVQFLSYEGTFTATNGPANGTLSTDIGVSEAGTSTVGHSLQLSGTGSDYTDFTWQGSAANTFGACNTGQTFQSPDPKINEFSASTTGTDVEFVEIYGPASTDFSTLTILEIEGDSGASAGTIDEVIAVGTTDANGFYLASLAANALENGTLTLLLVEGFTGAAGNDLDTDNDGTFDTTPWTRIVDAVAVNDGGAGDLTYGLPVLGVAYDGFAFAPGGASRIPDGTDTDAAADWVRNDFDLAGIPGQTGTPVFGEAYNTPGATNQAVPAELAPTVASTDPANGATGVAVGTAVTINFSEDVNIPSAAAFSLECPVGVPTGFTVTTPAALPGVTNTVVFQPAGNLPNSTTCTVTAVAAQITDADTDDPPDNMATDYVFSFTTAAPVVLTPIHTIQGPGAASPLDGAVVTTTGIVTAVRSAGFYIQEPDATVDADPLTSEGIYVYTGGAPPAAAVVGALVQVSGTVDEYAPGYASLTEITGPTVAQLSTGNPLPAPVVLTAAFPSPAGTYEQLEPLEGMRVSVPSMTVVTPTDGNPSANYTAGSSNGVFFGVVSDLARPFREAGFKYPLTPPGGTTIPQWDANPELIRVDSDGLTGATRLDLSSRTVITNVVGPLDYAWDRYTILPEPPPNGPVVSGEFAPTPVADPTATELTVASYNLQRFYDDVNDPAVDDSVLTAVQYAARLAKASVGIRDYMKTPDIVGVIEMENLTVLQALATQVNNDAVAAMQPDPMYQAYLIEGNDIGGIDVGYLVKTAPVAPGVPRVEVVSVTQELDGSVLTNPDMTTTVLHDRPPLMLRAIVHAANGGTYPVTVIENHLRSLGSIDSTSPGSNGWPTEGDRVRAKRLAQAVDLANFVQGLQGADPAERIVLMGDMNAFEVNDGYVHSMATMTGTAYADDSTVVPGDGADLLNPDLVNLLSTKAAAERYGYVFEDAPQNLDHMLVGAGLVAATPAYRMEHARINADFPEVDRPDTVVRLSDHDPVVGFFQVAAFASAGITTTLVDTPDPVYPGAGLTYTITVTNGGPDAATGLTLTDALPAGTLFASLDTSLAAGWGCVTPAVGANGTVTCTAPTLAASSSAVFTLSVTVDPAVTPGSVLTNTASVTQTSTEGTPGDESATATTTVQTPPDVYATKAVSGVAFVGAPLTYTIVLYNNGSTPQLDNPGDELVDVLPASLTLVSADATSGSAVATVATNTVTWNGSIPAGGSVTVTILAQVGSGVTLGDVISNQATVSYDADGNGTNESSAPSDDPATGTVGDATVVTVSLGPGGVAVIPAAGTVGLGLLALLVALGGALLVGRRLS
jgi:uncharacterized repeat protein (TIGR01451 family)